MSLDKMIRKQVYLESSQNEKVKMVSRRVGKSEAEIIREAIDQYVTSEYVAKDPCLSLLVSFTRRTEWGLHYMMWIFNVSREKNEGISAVC